MINCATLNNARFAMAQPKIIKKISAVGNTISASQSHLPPERKKIEKQLLMSFIWVTLFCIISYQFLDRPIAVFMTNVKHGSLSLSNFDFTDALTNITYFITLIIMSAYVICRFFNFKNRGIEISGVLCLGMMTAFFVKNQAQLFFGRIAPRYGSFEQLNFMRKSNLYGFHFMQGGSFPSGHMVIFTCVFLLFTFYFPKARTICYLLLSILAILLIYDNYHFLSDVVAGTYLGIIIAIALKFLVKIKPEPHKH